MLSFLVPPPLVFYYTYSPTYSPHPRPCCSFASLSLKPQHGRDGCSAGEGAEATFFFLHQPWPTAAGSQTLQ